MTLLDTLLTPIVYGLFGRKAKERLLRTEPQNDTSTSRLQEAY